MSDRDEKESPSKRKSDIIKRFSLKRLRSVRKSRSSTGSDADSISVTSSTPEKVRSTPRQSLSNYAPSIESPLSKSKVLERAPTPAVDIPPEQFWDHAYDQLKSKQPKLVDHYERILSLELRKIDVELEHLDIQNVIAERPAQRTHQMDRLLEASFANLEKHYDAKGNIGEAIDIILSVRSHISSGRTAFPISAIIWTGLCIALQLCLNPANEIPPHEDGIAILIQRMKWYCSLPQLLAQRKPHDERSTDLRTKLADQTLEFYQTLVKYAIQSTCAKYEHSTLNDPLESLELDEWTGSLDAIDKVESSLRTTLCLLDGGWNTSNPPNSDSSPFSGKDQEIVTACYVEDALSQNEESPSEEHDVLNTTEYTNFVNRHSSNTERILYIILDEPKDQLTPLVVVARALRGQLETHFDEPCLSYFFSRVTDATGYGETTILKGLIWLFLHQKPTLIGHIRKEFEDAGHDIFDGPSAFSHLKKVFSNMIHDNALGRIYLVIDAVDKCGSGLPDLLDLVVESSASPKVKWIISSQKRDRTSIDEALTRVSADSLMRLDLSGNLDLETADEAQLESPDLSSEIAPFTESSRLPQLDTTADSGESKEQRYPDPNPSTLLLSLSNIFLVLGLALLVYKYRDQLPTLHVKLYDYLRGHYDFN